VFVLCSVFWDLYCAAPERRDTCEHSSEAKAFHDYVSTTLGAVMWGSLRRSGYDEMDISRKVRLGLSDSLSERLMQKVK